MNDDVEDLILAWIASQGLSVDWASVFELKHRIYEWEAARSSAAPGTVTPEGYALVPIEPTAAMIVALEQGYSTEDRYMAMLEAALSTGKGD